MKSHLGVLVSDILFQDPELQLEALTRGPVGQFMYSIAMSNAYGNLELRLKLRASMRRQAVLAQIHRRALLLLASLVENGSNVCIMEFPAGVVISQDIPTRPSDPA